MDRDSGVAVEMTRAAVSRRRCLRLTAMGSFGSDQTMHSGYSGPQGVFEDLGGEGRGVMAARP
jgi:hypothetical protein